VAFFLRYQTTMIDLGTHLQETVQQLASELEVDVCSVYVLDRENQELVLTASQGLEQGAVGYRMPISMGLTGRVARTGKIVAMQNPERDPDFHHVPGSGEERCRTYMGLPLRDAHGVAGVLVVQTVMPHLFHLREIGRINEAVRRIERIFPAIPASVPELRERAPG
jgi:L-methionine (R)-S-oxide reductase